jgi:hypothetical protein
MFKSINFWNDLSLCPLEKCISCDDPVYNAQKQFAVYEPEIRPPKFITDREKKENIKNMLSWLISKGIIPEIISEDMFQISILVDHDPLSEDQSEIKEFIFYFMMDKWKISCCDMTIAIRYHDNLLYQDKLLDEIFIS